MSTKTLETKGVTITLCLTEDEGLDVKDGGKWLLMCETHGDITQDTNKNRLWGFAKNPEVFCGGCRKAGA